MSSTSATISELPCCHQDCSGRFPALPCHFRGLPDSGMIQEGWQNLSEKTTDMTWEFPKIRVPYLGVLIVRILLFRVLD